jgi:hypothetical protein
VEKRLLQHLQPLNILLLLVVAAAAASGSLLEPGPVAALVDC